jgi:hypothetical protein
MLGVMAKHERVPNAALSLISNTPGTSTGYGVQAQYLVDRLMRHGVKTAVQSNYGLEGLFDKIRTKHGDVMHYPKGYRPYSDDVIAIWAKDWEDKNPGVNHAIMTLYDVWVYKNLKYDGPIIAYVPLDHITIPPMVKEFLQRDNVTPVAMSPFGKRIMDDRGIDCHYAPHAFDAKVYKPTYKVDGVPTRQFMGLTDEHFLVSIVAANKSNGILHRKALSEQIFAYSLFKKKHPEARLYLHMEPSNVFGGFNIPRLLDAIGLDKDEVIFPDSTLLRVGYPAEHLAAFYTASDVVMNVTYGEGFGVTSIESQGCGARLLTSSWTASPDLAGPDSFLCDGEPLWDEPQGAFYMRPTLSSMVQALEAVYEQPRGISQANIDFAKQFEVEHVWDTYWLPFFMEFYGETFPTG